MAIYIPKNPFSKAALRAPHETPSYLVKPDGSIYGQKFSGGHLFNQDIGRDLITESKATIIGDVSWEAGRHVNIGRTTTQGQIVSNVNSDIMESKCAILCKVRLTAAVEDYHHFFAWLNDGSIYTRCHLLNSGRIKIYFDGNSQTWLTSSFTGLNWQNSEWETFLIQWDQSAPTKQIFYKDQKQEDTTAWTAGTTVSNNATLLSRNGAFSWEGNCEYFYIFGGTNFTDAQAKHLLRHPHGFLPPQIEEPFLLNIGGAGSFQLVVADSTHGHTADNIDLTQENVLVTGDTLHVHTVENIDLTQAGSLTIAESIHAHTAENIILTQANLLSIAEALHTQTSENLDLTQANLLAVAEATHGHVADNIDLVLGGSLDVQESTHAHTVDNIDLLQANLLAIDSATHGHTADNIDLTQANVLAVQATSHGHTAENITLETGLFLAVSDASHAQLADNIDLVQANILSVLDSVHAVLSDNVGLATHTIMIVSDALHNHLSDNITLTVGDSQIVHDDRIITIRAKDRIIIISAEDHVFNIQ